MAYRRWPAAVLTGAALVAACVVVSEHVVDARDGCLGSAGWFTATPASDPDASPEPSGPADADGTSGSSGVLPYPGASSEGKPPVERDKSGAVGTTTGGGPLASADEVGQNTSTDEIGQSTDGTPDDADELSGCLDLDRIEIPAPVPDSDDRA